MENIQYIKVELNKIGDRYADLRIIQPQAESSMERSMRLYGQMTPVIIGCEANKTYEMVDGFKRLRSGRKLGYTTLQAKIFSRGRHALKAAIIHLNTKTRTIASLETGLVIRSLYREDGLSQVEIAGLLGRHKSFVCRRLRLVENLSEEVLDHLKLGLINITIGRELARLPRGNQVKALSTIIKYKFTCAETSRLTNLLLKEPRWNHEKILQFPESILTNRQPDIIQRDKPSILYGRLLKMEVLLTTLSDAELSNNKQDAVLAVIERIQNVLEHICKRLVK